MNRHRTREMEQMSRVSPQKEHLMESQSPDFESIKQISPYQAEYWSARDLAPLLGYTKWQNFEVAVKRARTACEQVGQVVSDHFIAASKMVTIGSGAKREVKDYLLSRFACYLIAQNGDPRKPEIAAAQAYFAVSTRRHEIHQLYEEQQKRLQLRERVSENNRKLAEAAHQAGVLSRSFGEFQNAGYQGLYGGLDVEGIKTRKGLGKSEEVLDRMGRAELAATGARDQVARLAGDLADALLIGVADDRHDQAVVQRDRDPDVDPLLE